MARPRVLLLALEQEPPVLGPQIVLSPLVRACVERPDPAPRDQDVKLPVPHVVADVRRLHDHRLALEGRRARVVPRVVRRARELDLVAAPADIPRRRHRRVPVRELVRDLPRRHALARVRALRRGPPAGARRVRRPRPGDRLILRVAARHRRHPARDIRRPCAVRLAAIPVPRRVPVARLAPQRRR